MPIEELLAAYRQYSSPLEEQSRSSSEEEILSNQDLTLDKEQIGRDLLVEEDGPTSADELLDSVSMEIHSDMERMLRCKYLIVSLRAIQVLRSAFFWKFDTHPSLRNANNVEPYIFGMLFSGKSDTLPPPTA